MDTLITTFMKQTKSKKIDESDKSLDHVVGEIGELLKNALYF